MKQKLLQYIITIISLMIAFLVIMGIISFMFKGMEKEKAEDMEELTPECKSRCNSFDMTFYEIVNDGWLYHCWCVDDNKPFKVATLRADKK